MAAIIAGHDVRLTPTEWHLLEVMVRHPGKLMAQLRRKLEPDASRPKHLLTEPGMGYRFEP